MTEDKKPCRCSNLCNNYRECQENLPTSLLLPYELNPKPTYFGVSVGPYIHSGVRYCFFCNKPTKTKDESCIVCGLSKTNKE